MKSNDPLPCFRKTIVLDSAEYSLIKTALAYAIVTVENLTIDEMKTIKNIAAKLNSESHTENN